MEKSQLVDVLRTFSRKEIRDCRKWLQSPAHNHRNDVLELFEYLVYNDHLDNEKFLEKERVFRKIFPDESYDDAKLRQTMYFLLKALEDFLVYQELSEEPVGLQIALASVYRKRNLDRSFQKTMRGIDRQQDESHSRDSRFLLNQYLVHQENYRYLSQQQRTAQFNLQEVSNAIDIFFLADKLRQSCILLSHQAVYKTGYETGLLDEVLNYLEHREDLLRIPAVGIYYYIYRASTDKGNPVYFEELKSQIHEFGHLFSNSETRDIYLLAINYCIAKINTGDKAYFREAFELMRRGIENMVLIENGILNHYTFRNIVNIGTSLKEFEWVESFIHNYKDYLEVQHRENFSHYSLAKLHFEKGEYDKARQLLIHFEYSDILINLHAKSMLIRLYYEEGEFEALESLLESMRNYLHRKKVIGYHKNIYNTLIRFTKRLVRVNPYSREQRKKLAQEIEATRAFPEKAWLLKQLETM